MLSDTEDTEFVLAQRECPDVSEWVAAAVNPRWFQVHETTEANYPVRPETLDSLIPLVVFDKGGCKSPQPTPQRTQRRSNRCGVAVCGACKAALAADRRASRVLVFSTDARRNMVVRPLR